MNIKKNDTVIVLSCSIFRGRTELFLHLNTTLPYQLALRTPGIWPL